MSTDVEENFMLKKPFICKGNIIIYKCCYDLKRHVQGHCKKLFFSMEGMEFKVKLAPFAVNAI